MADVPYKHLSRDRSRHGQVRWYVRLPGKPRIRIRHEPGTEAFSLAYHDALEGREADQPKRRLPPKPGTLEWLCDRYREDRAFTGLAVSTQRAREATIRRICAKSGTARLADIDSRSVYEGREARAEKPEAANEFVKTLRSIFAWAVEAGHMSDNPAATVKLIPPTGDGFITWTMEEFRAFEAKHPLGTRERVALDVLLYTGLRISDAVLIGPQHVANGAVVVPSMVKTGAPIISPIVPPLAASLAAGPIGPTRYLVTKRGKPWSGPEAFGNWFSGVCDEAGVRGSAHGLRKLGAVIAAERGATENQLMALFGWKTGREAARYTKAASRIKLARDAAHLRVPEADPVAPPSEGETKRAKKL